jgi:5-methylcytosine-specific restriction endonuclease McrA
MSRSVPEWIGRDDDQRIPDYVKDRVANKAELYCQQCQRQVSGKLRAEFDHETPLILGGKNRESNIQLLCHECHRAKTKLDVKLKAKVSRVRKRHLGIKKPSKFACSRDSKFKKKIDGSVVLR